MMQLLEKLTKPGSLGDTIGNTSILSLGIGT
jgi:hypothetical protein